MRAAFFVRIGAAFLISMFPVSAGQDSEIITVGSDKFLRWQGRAGRTYFIQVSDPNDHLSKWTWAPIIETGNDEAISYEVDGTADKGFYRLWFSDQPTTDPDGHDFDYDGLSNWDEVGTHQTNPLEWDSDDDGLSDKWEIEHDLDPNDDGGTDPAYGADGDPDGDGLTNLFEYWHYADPNLTDTDGDGLNDFDEVFVYYTYPDSSDTEWDGLNDYDEVFTYGTDPWDWDSDEDTLDDGEEVLTHGTNPMEMDTDGDWMWDDYEIDNNLDPTNAADGLLDADSDTLANQLEFTFLDQGYDPFVANNATAFPWAGDTDWDGLSTQVEFITHRTNPRQNDTDGDLLPDNWEIQYGLNPLATSGIHGRNGDPDADGVGNIDELIHGASPVVADTDGDGAGDAQEIAQGSDPANAGDGGDPPPAEDIAQVMLTVGDPSGSESERYNMVVKGMEGDTRTITHQATEFGVVSTKTYKLRKGAKYEIEIVHTGTKPGFMREYGFSNYDWKADIQPAGDELLIKKDPHTILTEVIDWPNTTFQIAGKKADLFVMNFKTQTEAWIPVGQQARKKLGVGEKVDITVTPANAGEITWSLTNQQDSAMIGIANYVKTFTAASIACHPQVTMDFGDGISQTIQFEVVEPNMEVADKDHDLEPAEMDGATEFQQGVGMELDILVKPDDVSFKNVLIKELPGPGVNKSGYFLEVVEGNTNHEPNAAWVMLDVRNRWGDTAFFAKWPKINVNGSMQWKPGSYEWIIPVRWKLDGKPERNLPNRLQKHEITANDGTSMETKMQRSAMRTPTQY